MNPRIDELVDQMAAADRMKMLAKLAKKVMTDQGENGLDSLTLGDEPPFLFLVRCPPIPNRGPYTDADRAEDARRLANRDDSVTVDELMVMLDFRADRSSPARS